MEEGYHAGAGAPSGIRGVFRARGQTRTEMNPVQLPPLTPRTPTSPQALRSVAGPSSPAPSGDRFQAGSSPREVRLSEAAQVVFGNGPLLDPLEVWRQDLKTSVSSLGVSGEGSILAQVREGYRTLARQDGTEGPRATHENLGCLPAPGSGGSTWISKGGRVIHQGASGKVLGEWDARWAVREPLVPLPDGSVLAVPCAEGKIARVGPDGTALWESRVVPPGEYGGITAPPTLAPGGDRLYVNQSGSLHALDLETGEVRWSRDREDLVQTLWFNTRPAVSPDGDVFVNGDSTLQCLAPDGTLRWAWSGVSRRRIEQVPPELRQDHLDPSWGPMSCPPAVSADGSRVYCGGRAVGEAGANLHALDREGREAWSARLDEHLCLDQLRVGEDGTIYAAGTSYEMDLPKGQQSHHAHVYALSPEGEVLWHYRLPDAEGQDYGFSTWMAVQGRTVYLADSWGTVAALHPDAANERVRLAGTAAGPGTIVQGETEVMIGGLKLPVRQG